MKSFSAYIHSLRWLKEISIFRDGIRIRSEGILDTLASILLEIKTKSSDLSRTDFFNKCVNIVLNRGRISVVPSRDFVLIVGNKSAEAGFILRPPKISRIIGAGVENDLKHLGRIRIIAVFVGVGVDPSGTNKISGVERIYLEELTHDGRIGNGSRNGIRTKGIVHKMGVIFLRRAVERIGNYAD